MDITSPTAANSARFLMFMQLLLEVHDGAIGVEHV